DTEALPFQFGQPFQETAVLRSDAVGAAHFDNATFTWTLNSITNSNGDVVNADIEAVPEPSTAWILMLGVALLAFRKRGISESLTIRISARNWKILHAPPVGNV